MLELLSCEGFDVAIIEENRWDIQPIARPKLAPAFREMTDDDLLVSVFSAVLKPSGSGAGWASA
ncbi:MAG: hypothetical protein JSU95_17600 [Betaproteobacteria bacterium]|nr:MAG: hypothetical protein JSU95_17600 [Betaproteobacteria bacterium]